VCQHEFNEPALEERIVTQYLGLYEGAWWPLYRQVPFKALDTAHLTRAAQHSIRELDQDRLSDLFADVGWQAKPWERPSSGGSDPTGGWGAGSSRWRLGQAAYRQQLLERDGQLCAISGPQPAHILDAVHWTPFARSGRHRLDRGLMLRRDLHALVDAYDLTIDAVTWTVRVNPALGAFPDIQRWDGQAVRIPPERLDRSALQEHFDAALQLW
jgi:hypothetical protein